MLSALYASARLSVRLSVTRVNQSKTIEVRILKFSPHHSSFCVGKCHLEILTGSHERGRQTKEGWENKPFSYVIISKTVRDSPQLLLMTNRKLHMRFRLTPRSMTLSCYKFEV